ncbi:molecular chaperone DnaJ [Sorangium sp. So ce363]|uniref:molecular chaperone DnaJ n=1 Tax=Sorangium sp. So ce363 TaxID=3133304 RepID=UPI003F63E525
MAGESCGICGGDGRIANSFSGTTATCPGCHGTGRRSDDTGFRDVTKTKPSHFRQPNKQAAVEKPEGPASLEGIQLAREVNAAAHLSSGTKAKLTLEIMEHEATHGKCTQTFIKKVRKQLRPPGS